MLKICSGRCSPAFGLFGAAIASLYSSLYRANGGATAIEYGLIAALIAVAAVTALGNVGTGLTTTFSTVASSL